MEVSRRATATAGALLVTAAATTLGIVVPLANQLQRPPFFDEMWRLDLIHSDDVLAAAKTVPNTTAVPAGWVALNKAAVALAGRGLHIVRGLDIVFLVAGLVAFCGFLLVAGGRHCGRAAWPWWGAAVVGCVALSLTQMFADLGWYANNYSLDVLVAALLLLTSIGLGRRPWVFAASLAIVALVPLLSLSAVVLLPAAVARLFWWARDRGRGAVAAVVGSAIASAAIAIVAYVVLYRPVVDRPESATFLAQWWQGDRLQSGRGDPLLLGRTAAVLRDGLLGAVMDNPGPTSRVVLSLAVVAFAVFGAVAITRQWRWFAAFLGSGWLGVLGIGLVTGAPVTPVRVVVGYWVIVALCAAFGAAYALALLVAAIARALGAADTGPVGPIAFGVVGFALLALAWPNWSGRYPTFTVVDEYDYVAGSPAPHNTVLAYHYLTEPYARDRLLNDEPAGRFTVVPARLGDHGGLDTPLDARFAALARGDRLWCVIPYALGPRAADRACRFRGEAPTPVVRYHGPNGEVIAYQR